MVTICLFFVFNMHMTGVIKSTVKWKPKGDHFSQRCKGVENSSGGDWEKDTENCLHHLWPGGLSTHARVWGHQDQRASCIKSLQVGRYKPREVKQFSQDHIHLQQLPKFLGSQVSVASIHSFIHSVLIHSFTNTHWMLTMHQALGQPQGAQW